MDGFENKPAKERLEILKVGYASAGFALD